MAEPDKGHGVYVEVTGRGEEEDVNKSYKKRRDGGHYRSERETLYHVLYRMISVILFPEAGDGSTLLHRIKASVSQNVPLIPEASRNTGLDVLLWTRRGSPLRALLVVSVGTITLVTLTGLLVFTVFFVAATVNAIVISLLVSLAAAGGFLALFFAFATAIYIGALSLAIFTISTAVFWAGVAILITTGWIGFFFTVWLVTKESIRFAKHLLCVTVSAISTYMAALHARHLLLSD